MEGKDGLLYDVRMEQKNVELLGKAYVLCIEQGPSGSWSAHTTEPDVVGGLGETPDTAIADWQDAMLHWLAYAQDAVRAEYRD